MSVPAKKVPEKSIVISDEITITVVEIGNGKVRLGICAPSDVAIERHALRSEGSAGKKQTVHDHIEINPIIADGKARIGEITVDDIVIWHERHGKTDIEIAAEHKLTRADVHAALAYYFDHQDEIDRRINDRKQQATRQMLDELDGLMEKMLALPVNNAESAPSDLPVSAETPILVGRESQPMNLEDSSDSPSILHCFLQGVGSVLEFFPPPERFDAWRLTHDTPLNERPDTLRNQLAGLYRDAPQ